MNSKLINGTPRTNIQRVLHFFIIGTLLFAALSVHANTETEKKEAPILARSAGTAFAVNEQGYLITSNHIIQNADDIVIFSSEGSMGWRGKVVKVNKKFDLALIKIDTVTKANPIATWNTVPNGLEIFAFGFPNPSIQGRELKITSGLVNSLEGLTTKAGVFQFSAPIQRGNSGGPVVGSDGTIIGLISGKLEGRSDQSNSETLQNVNFAVRSEELVKFLSAADVTYTAKSLDLSELKRSHELFQEMSPGIYSVVAIRGTMSQKESLPSVELVEMIGRLPSDQKPKLNGAFKAGFDEILNLESEQILLKSESINFDRATPTIRSFDFIISLSAPRKLKDSLYSSMINSAKFDCKNSTILLTRQEHKKETFGTGETLSAMKRRADAKEEFKALGSKPLTQFFYNNVCQSIDNGRLVKDLIQ